METKRCGTCREHKPLDEFTRLARAKDGLLGRCRDCDRARKQKVFPQSARGQERDRNQKVRERQLAAKTKVCTRCGKRKAKDQFYKQASCQGGLNPACKACVNAYNRLRETEQQRQRWNHAAHLRHSTGVDEPTYAELLAAQGGVCAICEKPNANGRRLSVDHDHRCCPGSARMSGGQCGKCVRGLLCGRCNSALGMVYDDPALLRKLAEYIEAHASMTD